MKIAVMSDLHLEFYPLAITNTQGADVLVLAGDILIADDLRTHPTVPDNGKLGPRQASAKLFRDFLANVSAQYPHVVYVAGNHEFYHGKWTQTIEVLRAECSKFPNIHFLEQDSVELDNVVFVGGTLWTDMNKVDPYTLHSAGDAIADFKHITDDSVGYTKLRPATTVTRHRDTLRSFSDAIRNACAAAPKKVVVVSHHSPSTLSCPDRFKSNFVLNGAFHSDLSEFILDRPEIVLWCHGHTHDYFDYTTIGNCRIVCNPRGYCSEQGCEPTCWNPEKVIEI